MAAGDARGTALKSRAPDYRRTAGIAARAAAAIGGGYALASLAAVALALILPLNRMDAVLVGMMAGLVVFAAAAIWAFAARSAMRACIGIIAAALPLAALAMLGHWQMTGQVLP
jgi:hypothetical protein